MTKMGTIYKLTDGTNDYYGFSTIYLRQKLACMYGNLKKGKNTCYNCILESDSPTDIIVLEEDVAKEDSAERLRWYMKNYDCVNKKIPGRTRSHYYYDNREKILAKQSVDKKQYYIKNRDKIKERSSKYYYEKVRPLKNTDTPKDTPAILLDFS